MSKLARCEGVKTYISLATDVGAFKFLVVQLFDGNLQITGSFEFHKAEVSISQNRLIAWNRPTLCHRDHDRPRNRPRRGWSDVQNLSSPMGPSKSESRSPTRSIIPMRDAAQIVHEPLHPYT